MTASSKHHMAFVFGVALLAGSVCLAAPAASNPGVPFQQLADQNAQIQSVVDEIPEIIYLTAGDEMDLLRLLQGRVTLMAKVDTKACASNLTQCAPAPFSAANDQNAEPVRLFVQVSQYERGVTGLTADAFVIANPFYPGGGRVVQKCDTHCGSDWFQDGGNGLYSIFLEPLPLTPQQNWQAGEYAAAINVTVTDFFSREWPGTTMVTFEIPSAPPNNVQ